MKEQRNSISNYLLAYRPAPRTFQLALRGYSVASLPRASRSHLARFARARFALRAHKIFQKKKCVSIDSKFSESRKNAKKFFLPLLTHYALRATREVHENFRKKKKSVSQSSRNALKRIEMKKKIFTPLTDYASGEAQPYLPHVTRRVPRSVHAKFHADWTKTVGARGIQTNRQTDKQTELF